MDEEKVVEYISENFKKMFQTKTTDKGLEIITPYYLGTTSIAVSVFVTIFEDGFKVSDGGWLDNQYYDCGIRTSLVPLDTDAEFFSYDVMKSYHAKVYGIKERTMENDSREFYLKIQKFSDLPTAVMDLASAILASVTTAYDMYWHKHIKPIEKHE